MFFFFFMRNVSNFLENLPYKLIIIHTISDTTFPMHRPYNFDGKGFLAGKQITVS